MAEGDEKKRKGNVNCCVVNCFNSFKNSPACTHFYTFPTAAHKKERREKWIILVNRKNPDGTPWQPSAYSRICSQHFVGNEKSENPLSPSYIPTIFPKVYKKREVDLKTIMERHKRYKLLEIKKQSSKIESPKSQTIYETMNIPFYDEQAEEENNICANKMINKSVEVNFLPEESQIYESKIFICNRYIFSTHNDAETQAFIPDVPRTLISLTKKTKDKNVGTDQVYCSRGVGPDEEDRNENGFLKCRSGFHGISDEKKISKNNRLLIFLCKMKLGLSYSALGVLFGVDRKTISRIFLSTLEYLVIRCQKFVIWPSKEVVRSTMPNEFKEMYENCRVIIDCTEIKIDQASSVEGRVQTYSHYKKGFTIKILIGCTPSGLVSFVSKCYGGRISDAQITTLSGFLDLLEPDDLVLADKGFPGIQSTIDERGNGMILVMPPFLRNGMFSEEEVEVTYQVAKFRIHVERIMQRIRIYNILSKLPMHLLPHADNIVFMYCVLVNLQPPIFKDNESEDAKKLI